MPDAQRLDMAIKYSAEPYSNNLLEVSEMAICLFLSFFVQEKITRRVPAFCYSKLYKWLVTDHQPILLTLLGPSKLLSR